MGVYRWSGATASERSALVASSTVEVAPTPATGSTSSTAALTTSASFTTSTTSAPATATVVSAATTARLDESLVNVDDGLLLALSLALGLLRRSSDKGLLFRVRSLQLLGSGPLLVLLHVLVGLADGQL